MRFFISLAFSLNFLALAPVSATTMITTTPEQKMKQSDEICAVQVTALRTEKRMGSVVTIATAQTLEPCYVKGTQGPIELIWPGGTFKDNAAGKTLRTTVPGAPQLKIGQTSVLFLERKAASGPFIIHSWQEGIVGLERKKSSQQFIVSPRDARKFGPAAEREKKSVLKEESLDAFRQRIQTVRSSR